MDDRSLLANWIAVSDHLFAFIEKRVKSVDDAKDLLQEIFITYQLKIHQLNDQGKLMPWLYQVARNTINDYFRKRQMQGIQPLSENDEHTIEGLEECLYPIVSMLDPFEQKLIIDYELNGISQKELAAKYELNYTTLRSRIQHIRKKMKAHVLSCCRIVADNYGVPIQLKPKSSGCC